ncbi:hypothetical protein AYO22_07332 [Fonsecaea multimorphosa]|nr:hypothetical protein AYO22_07332 [Fonsecaea multimorphosa]
MDDPGSVHARAAIPAKRVKLGVWVAGVPCEFNLNGRKRPFYRVSGDVFDHSIKLLRQFVSEEELPDLTVDNIQKVLTKLEMRSSSRAVVETPSREIESSGADIGVDDTHPAPDETQEVVESDEHPLLQEDLGCMMLDPGTFMPLGYQALSLSLVKLRKKISYDCFLEPAQSGGRLPIKRVFNSLTCQYRWLESVPSYLHWKSSLPPQHRRAVAVLHLRYWVSIIFITRPFLLFSVTKPSRFTVPAKQKCYEELSTRCIQAAERAVEVVKHMREAEILSSMTLFDCHSIGEVMWILILAFQKHSNDEYRQLIRFCLDTLKSMDQVGWCEKVLPDLEARVQESGALDPAGPVGSSRQTLPERIPPQTNAGTRLDDSVMTQAPLSEPSQALEDSFDFPDL